MCSFFRFNISTTNVCTTRLLLGNLPVILANVKKAYGQFGRECQRKTEHCFCLYSVHSVSVRDGYRDFLLGRIRLPVFFRSGGKVSKLQCCETANCDSFFVIRRRFNFAKIYRRKTARFKTSSEVGRPKAPPPPHTPRQLPCQQSGSWQLHFPHTLPYSCTSPIPCHTVQTYRHRTATCLVY
jgi:hypothetical protein